MRFGGVLSRSRFVPIVMMAALAPPALVSSAGRAAADGDGVGAQSVMTRAASDAAGQPAASSVDRSISQQEDDDPGGGGPPFGFACPFLIGVPWSTKLLGTSDYDGVGDVTTDDEVCAIYVVGSTRGSLAGAAGASDAFIARYSTTGALIWIRQFGTAAEDAGAAVATDSQHNIYVTGYTEGTLPGSPNANQGASDIYLTKYDQNGNRLWTRQLGSGAIEYGTGVAVDENDEVVVAANTYGVLPGAGGSAGGGDYVLARYDGNGILLAIIQQGTSADDFASDVAIGVAGNIYIAGGTSGALSGASSGLEDVFVGKYNRSLGLIWLRQRGTSAADSASGIAVNADGQVFVCGYTSGSLDGFVNQGFTDAFILRYDANGTWVWTDQRGTSAYDFANSVAVSTSGGPYTTGFTLDSLDGNFHAGLEDAFVMKHGKAGTWRWTRQIGTTEKDLGYAIAVDGWDNVYVGGITAGDLSGIPNAGDFDAFVMKFDSAGIVR
jgi:hypothetical protein